MSYTVGNCLRDNMSIFLYLFANVHIFSEICTNGRLIFISPRISSSSGTVLRVDVQQCGSLFPVSVASFKGIDNIHFLQ